MISELKKSIDCVQLVAKVTQQQANIDPPSFFIIAFRVLLIITIAMLAFVIAACSYIYSNYDNDRQFEQL